MVGQRSIERLRLNVPQSALQIGIAGYSQPEDNRLGHTLTLPFRQQRDYWQKPDGTRSWNGTQPP